MRYTDTPPYAPVLMESTRAIGYSAEAAIADIIDNSIAAKADRIDIDFFPIGDASVSILDNGKGMSEKELISAMRYGSADPLTQRDDADLGRYGLGLKTASLSQCRSVTVISKKREKISGAQWNLNHIKQTKTWSLIVLDKEEIQAFSGCNKLMTYTSGTLVIWQDLDKFTDGDNDVAETFRRKTRIIREHLSLVFHRYLSGEPGLKRVDIKMNNRSLEAQDPFLVKKSTQLMDEEIIVVRGQKVKIKPYILPHASKLTQKELKELGNKEGLRKAQGFYIYRNRRLIVWGTWFRLMRQGDMTKLARVQVDIPNTLDDLWALDIKKSVAMPPEEVRRNLAVVMEKIAEGSKRTWTYRGRKETDDKIIHVWDRIKARDGGIYYEINLEYPIIKRFMAEHPEIKAKMEFIFKRISAALPLNSLYIDLTNDEKVTNDSETNEAEAISMLRKIVMSQKDVMSRYDMIELLKMAEPFNDFREEIEKAKGRGEFDD